VDDIIDATELFKQIEKICYPVVQSMDEKEYLWYKLLCYYHAKTELYDRTLTDERSPYDPTEAFITSRNRSTSEYYAEIMYTRIRIFASKLKIPDAVIQKNKNGITYRYSAQGWINEYNRLVKDGEMGFINKVMNGWAL
jgi:hypothetical protein